MQYSTSSVIDEQSCLTLVNRQDMYVHNNLHRFFTYVVGLRFRVSGLVVFIVGLEVRVSVWGFRALNNVCT